MKKKNILSITGFAPLTWIFFIFLYLPIITLLIFSFNDSRSTTVWSGFTLKWFYKLADNHYLLNATYNSLIVAISAASIAVVLATFAALSFARGKNFKAKTAAYNFLHVPLIMPEMLTAIATLSFFSFIGLKMGLLNIIIAHVTFSVPFAFVPIYNRIRTIGTEIEQAAFDLYAKPHQVLLNVTLPLLSPAILSGFMIAFIMSLDDFIITFMIARPGSTTLPIYIYGLVKTGVTPEINAISSMLLALSTIIVLIVFKLQRNATKF